MTRDEAIELAHEQWVQPNAKSSECIVDILSALGILKLDEPKSPTTRLALGLGWPEGGRAEGDLRQALEANGLKIVEK